MRKAGGQGIVGEIYLFIVWLSIKLIQYKYTQFSNTNLDRYVYWTMSKLFNHIIEFSEIKKLF